MKRITLLAGHYGSGKTNIAVNLALREAGELRRGLSVPAKTSWARLAIADLDIVNPYFRTEDSREELERAGVRLICSEYANSNVDLPSMPEDLYAVTDDRELRVIVDVGGDDRGALALGRLSAAIREEGNYEMLMVLSCCRPLTRTAAEAAEVLREIELAGRIPFTGLIDNSNLGRDTRAEDVLASLAFAEETSALTGLPLVAVTAERAVCESLTEAEKERIEEAVRRTGGMMAGSALPALMPLDLQKRPV